MAPKPGPRLANSEDSRGACRPVHAGANFTMYTHSGFCSRPPCQTAKGSCRPRRDVSRAEHADVVREGASFYRAAHARQQGLDKDGSL
eukprot:CAMPEP_0170439836 /NCGR_PEP_ID=MMETSP0117_2-20130122/46001_1 /TAXON_ID=400756 /ORGANISM="Durinskia baltica, Strain CSIRO CS-38" /LENGTH=87 /DNA_ID=CAMNT_0010700193 /DNA_START=222 /DNA_END=482 /DNA_ORIENTATION=+